jgi:DNA repair protein RecN (Recombination protein N)
MDPRLAHLHEQLISVMELTKECSDELRDYGQGIEYDTGELEQVQERLAAIEDVAHKHHVKASALCDLQQSLCAKLDRFESPEFDIDQLQRIMNKNEQAFFALAGQITSTRQQAATTLGKAVTAEMKHLGLGKAKLQVQVSPADSTHRHGCDQVQFLVQTNPGQPSQPLAKIASGGELSRISLALQLVLLDKMQVSTMIFDEVDAGVGGATAEVVGVQLRRLGESKQVFCVTHLPQVAAKAHHHLRVNKQSSAHYTTSAVEHLDVAERVSEIARMLGGVKLTENTYSHAREMLGTNVLQ